jgi:hypothetical protein
MAPARVEPYTCGTPYPRSRTIVTSDRGEYVRSAWPARTPNVASLKKNGIWSSVSPGTKRTSLL